MACYLVISSRHLSNGHYRGIKGVFRGPLCTDDARSPDYAEKEKAAAKALEDVKSNFYCELCDKQYHKHQEFDNHINSYDHAHKQRLKDLKQREFARNVASKSWKDEKKQEKALKRLHQLAELRKHITGSGPLHKAPRLAVEKQQPADGIFLCKGNKFTASSQRTASSEGQGFSRSVLEKKQLIISRHQSLTERPHGLGHQVTQVFPDSTSTSQRAGVSFSFSKKVPLRLESSASVFSENAEEGNDCGESPNHKVKQTLECCHSGTLLEEDMKPSLGTGPPVAQDRVDLDNSVSGHVAVKPRMLKENEKSGDRALEEKVSAHSSSSKAKVQLSSLDFSGSCKETEQEGKWDEPVQLIETLISPLCQASSFCAEPSTYKHSSAHLPEQLPELPAQPAPGLACTSPGLVKPERFLESTGAVNGNLEMLPRETLVKEVKPQELPFLHVVSKDGTTALQWPTELLLFTKTEPCISYGCNPLYFDFRLSLNHRDGKQDDTGKESCREHSTADGKEVSGLIKHKQTSNEQDNLLLKPKKMKGSLNLRKAKQKAESEMGRAMKEDGQNCVADDLNENIPKVPAYLDVPQKDCVTGKNLHGTLLRRPLKHHFRSCERKNIRSGSFSFAAFMSRIRKSKAAKCPLIYSEEKPENQKDVAGCSSDSDKDSRGSCLCCKSSSNSRSSENEECGSYTRCWRFLSPPVSSSSSDTSASGRSSYPSPTSNNHKSSHLLFCCRRKSKRAKRHKCRHRKHKPILSSDETDQGCCRCRSHRIRDFLQRGTVKYRKCSRHEVLQHRDRCRHTDRLRRFVRCRRSRSCHGSRICSTRESSERSSSSRVSRGSSSRSFSKQTGNCDEKNKENLDRGASAELGKGDTAHHTSLEVSDLSKTFASCSSETLAKGTCGHRKALTAKVLLEKVQSKKTQEQTLESRRFPNACGAELKGHSQSNCALQCSPAVDDVAVLPVPEKLLSTPKTDTGHEESSSLAKIGQTRSFEASQLSAVGPSTGADYDRCLFEDIAQVGAACQSPSVTQNTAIKEQPNLFAGEVQPLVESCDSVPNDFPGAFPSRRYSVVANSTEAKEELHEVNMELGGVEGSADPLCGGAGQKCEDTAHDLQAYSKATSPPLTQHPVTFSPEEVDKYRLLQLQAQQHMQKQLLAKHLKVLPAPGPAVFSATPAVPALPAQQHATVTTIQHTLLHHFALSASVHPQGSHLSLAHLHPLSQAHFAPISLTPLAPALIPTHPALLAGHPLHLVSTTTLHPSPLAFPALPHTAYIPALLTPQLHAATPSVLQPNPFVYPVFQGQEPHHHSCSSQTQQVPTIKEIFSVSSYLN
ncbi:Z804B protein, partial [Rhinopomastus cyanomelas]|nr:Z804B protein [Rhinopomastus cyanomelas]